MSIAELLDAAKRAKGTFGALAEEMGCHQNRFSEWRKGERKPDAGEIVQLAEIAGLPVLSTLAEIESTLDTKHSHVWKAALGKLTAAGVAASLVAVAGLTPDKANAEPSPSQANGGASVHYVNKRRRSKTQAFAFVNRLTAWVKRATKTPKFSQC